MVEAGPAGTSKGTLQLVLCVVSSAVAGIGIGLFGCLLSASDHLRRRNAGVHTGKSRCFQVLGIIGSIVFGLASLVGLIFGSVSLATVVRAGSTLPSNAVFSQMLGLRPLVRDDVLGTLVTISGIVSFTIFQGWAFYQHSRSEYLMHMARPASLVWQGFLLIAQVSSVCWLCNNRSPPRDRKEERGPARKRAVAATMICACSSAFMDLAAKGWSSFHVKEDDFIGRLDPGFSSPVFWTCLSGNVIFLVLMRWGTIYGCRRCDVLIFVPLNTTANIILSVASGMICLAEYRSVKSWPGLVTAGVSMLCGIFMLVTGPAETTPSTTLSIVDSEGGSKQSISEEESPQSFARSGTSQSSGLGDPEISATCASDSAISPSSKLRRRIPGLSFVYLNRVHRRAAAANARLSRELSSTTFPRETREEAEDRKSVV